MDNPKIITVNKNTEININGLSETFTITHTQNYIVVSETETHFFFNFERGLKASVWKSKIQKITYKDRTLRFSDLKKSEFLNLIDNHKKLIKLCQKMSKLVSTYDINEYDMSIYNPDDLILKSIKNHLILTTSLLEDSKLKLFSCKIPKKFIWDHSWKKNLKKYLEDKSKPVNLGHL